jgi:hypothetical protein
MTPEQRVMRARVASNTRWAMEPDRKAAVKPANDGWVARFERQVDPDNALEPGERRRRAQSAMKAHMNSLALRSSRVRAKRKNRGTREDAVEDAAEIARDVRFERTQDAADRGER